MAFDVQDGEGSPPKTRRLSLDQQISASTATARRSSDAKGKGRALEFDVEEEVQKHAQESPKSCYDSDEDEAMHCAICLSVIDDRTVLQPCNHDAFCFVCILAWTDQSRKCPLCISAIDVLLHNIRSEKDFQRHYLPPLIEKEDPEDTRARNLFEGARRQLRDRPTHPRFKYADWQARNRPASMPDMDQEDLALQKRRYVYRHGLYVKHVASNRYTRYRDHSAQQFSTTPELKQRLTRWLRRELQVFDGVDLEFLVGYCVSIASQLELRSDAAVRLLSEFLGDRDAEHFLHETHSFMRSPFKDIRNYDRAVQYDRPDRKISSYSKSTFETQKKSTATASQRRADPMLLQADSRAPRPRSRSVSSDSEPDYPRRNSLTRSRRRSSDSRAREPPVRARRDVYIPDYSRKQASRRPSQSLRRRSPSRGTWRREPEQVIAETPTIEDNASRQPANREAETPVLVQEEMNNGLLLGDLQDLSDIEDIISLGGSDVDTASLVTPLNHVAEVRHHHDASPEPGPSKEVNGKPAISIRGVASLVKAGSFPDNLAQEPPRQGERDLLSRISQLPAAVGRMHQDRLMHDKSTVVQDMPAVQKYSGTVSSDLKAALMARLKEEKDLHQAAESKVPSIDTADREETLRRDVLAIMIAKRQKAAQLSEQMADLRAELQQRADQSHKAATDIHIPMMHDRQAALRAKIDRERRMMELKTRLLEEKGMLRTSQLQF